MAKTLSEIVSLPRVSSSSDICAILAASSPEDVATVKKAAFDRTTQLLGNYVYYRGLIELSNICTASCQYCGIRKLNYHLKRFQMTRREVIDQAVWAARQGYGSIAIQAGERHDRKFIGFISICLREIADRTRTEALPNGVGVTLSLGDQEESVYAEWAEAYGNKDSLRYLSRFETSNPALFRMLHNAPGSHEKNLERRLECLRTLRRLGYQVGTGVMIGIPGQTLEDLAADIQTFRALDVDMIGMGPYLMSSGRNLQKLGQMEPSRLLQLSLNMIAATRLVMGNVNIAATTACRPSATMGARKASSMDAMLSCPICLPLSIDPTTSSMTTSPA